jgi:hypothetical protein
MPPFGMSSFGAITKEGAAGAEVGSMDLGGNGVHAEASVTRVPALCPRTSGTLTLQLQRPQELSYARVTEFGGPTPGHYRYTVIFLPSG